MSDFKYGPMTVGELKDHLNNAPNDGVVTLNGFQTGFCIEVRRQINKPGLPAVDIEIESDWDTDLE